MQRCVQRGRGAGRSHQLARCGHALSRLEQRIHHVAAGTWIQETPRPRGQLLLDQSGRGIRERVLAFGHVSYTELRRQRAASLSLSALSYCLYTFCCTGVLLFFLSFFFLYIYI